MTDGPLPQIPTQFVAPDDDTPAHLRHPDDPEFRHLDGSPSQIPKVPAQHDFAAPAPWVSAAVRESIESEAFGPAADAPERDEEAVAATPAAAPPRPDTAPRTPIAAGTYAIYDDDAGGLVLVAQTADGQTHHKHVPAKLIKMAQMMTGPGNPLAGLFGG